LLSGENLISQIFCVFEALTRKNSDLGKVSP
jgi:hypothetical protein